jgi:hypothetical protein
MFDEMKYTISLTLLLVFLLSSCQDDNERRRAENEKEAQKKAVIFSTINKGWTFIDEPINEISEKLTHDWTEWREFLKELGGKPRTSIGAFQKKSAAISKKAVSLQRQMDVLVEKSKIPTEEGEADFLRMLDTARAIPSSDIKPTEVK